MISKEEKSLPAHPLIFAILIYMVWTWVTSATAFEFSVGEEKLSQFMKTIIFALLSTMITSAGRRRHDG
jgi:hypothetical protein